MLDVNKLVVSKPVTDGDSGQQMGEVRVEAERLHQQSERAKSADQTTPQMTIRTRLSDADLQKLIDDGWRIQHAQFVPVGDEIAFCAVFIRETQPIESQPIESQPIEAQPVESQPVETQPIESQVSENQAAECAPVRTVKPSLLIGIEADATPSQLDRSYSGRIHETARRRAPSMYPSGETYDDLLEAANDVSIEPKAFTRRVLDADLSSEDRKALLNQHLFNRAEAYFEELRRKRPAPQFRTMEEIVRERREKREQQTLAPGTDQCSSE